MPFSHSPGSSSALRTALHYAIPSMSFNLDSLAFVYGSIFLCSVFFSIRCLPWLSWNSLCRPRYAWPYSKQFSYTCLLSVVITGLCQHSWLLCFSELTFLKMIGQLFCEMAFNLHLCYGSTLSIFRLYIWSKSLFVARLCPFLCILWVSHAARTSQWWWD